MIHIKLLTYQKEIVLNVFEIHGFIIYRLLSKLVFQSL